MIEFGRAKLRLLMAVLQFAQNWHVKGISRSLRAKVAGEPLSILKIFKSKYCCHVCVSTDKILAFMAMALKAYLNSTTDTVTQFTAVTTTFRFHLFLLMAKHFVNATALLQSISEC